jgi:hypothetical protein
VALLHEILIRILLFLRFVGHIIQVIPIAREIMLTGCCVTEWTGSTPLFARCLSLAGTPSIRSVSFCSFIRSPHANAATSPRLRQDRFLINPFQSITVRYIYSLDTDIFVKQPTMATETAAKTDDSETDPVLFSLKDLPFILKQREIVLRN